MKKGKLNNNERFLIQNLYKAGCTVDEICENIDRSKAVVEKHLADTQRSLDKIEEDKPKVKNPATTTMKITTKAGNKIRGAIMTPAASGMLDATRPSRVTNRINKNAIHKINGEEDN